MSIIGNDVKINYFDPLFVEMSSECFNVAGICCSMKTAGNNPKKKYYGSNITSTICLL